MKILRFHRGYFLLTVILFVVEVLIAKFLNDRLIRPYVGDVLVVILVYCFVRSFFNTPVFVTAIGSLLFAYFVETLQYFQIVDKLGLQDVIIARTVLGTSAEWTDIFAYTLGIAIVLIVENIRLSKRINLSKQGQSNIL